MYTEPKQSQQGCTIHIYTDKALRQIEVAATANGIFSFENATVQKVECGKGDMCIWAVVTSTLHFPF